MNVIADKAGLLAAFKECAALLELAGENPFKARAYEQGARALEALAGDPPQWVAAGLHRGVKGIGPALLEKIEEYAATGQLALIAELRERVPPGLRDLLRVPGLGPKKIQAVREQLGITSLEALKAAAEAGRLDALAGFGAKTSAKILEGIRQRETYRERFHAHAARGQAELLLERLRATPGTGRAELAGSLRRWRETAKDVDLVATSGRPAELMQAFTRMPNVERVLAQGPTKSSVLLTGGLQADLRVVAEHEFVPALAYFTGSKEHNTALRGRAKALGLKLNEYGLFPAAGGGGEQGEPLPLADEAALYRRLGLEYIPPELREGLGELEAAGQGRLPELLEPADLRGCLHCHTTWSDGHLSVRELAVACLGLGFEYLAICDHSQSAGYAGGLSPAALERQCAEIDAVNAELRPFHIFKGTESDILADGRLDYPDELLARLDFVVASVHSRMGLDEAAMTERICRALRHPATRVLGHPTGRLLLRREPYKLDLTQVLTTAAGQGVAIEINANPHRLDLDWRCMREAKALGCRFAVNPDAHDTADLHLLRYGVGVARKGWLTAADVINTLDRAGFEAWLRRR